MQRGACALGVALVMTGGCVGASEIGETTGSSLDPTSAPPYGDWTLVPWESGARPRTGWLLDVTFGVSAWDLHAFRRRVAQISEYSFPGSPCATPPPEGIWEYGNWYWSPLGPNRGGITFVVLAANCPRSDVPLVAGPPLYPTPQPLPYEYQFHYEVNYEMRWAEPDPNGWYLDPNDPRGRVSYPILELGRWGSNTFDRFAPRVSAQSPRGTLADLERGICTTPADCDSDERLTCMRPTCVGPDVCVPRRTGQLGACCHRPIDCAPGLECLPSGTGMLCDHRR